MKAKELLNRVLDSSPWVDPKDTVDKIIEGDPEKELKKVLVVWRCSAEAVQFAADNGYDGILTHEPTYYFHENETAQLAALPDNSSIKETAIRKQNMIRSSRLVVARIHDSWDSMDEIGVAASWAGSLGLTNRVQKSVPPDCECRYDTLPLTAGNFLEIVKEAVKDYQIPAPNLFGDLDQIISKVGLGAGCIASVEKLIKMGCDIAVVCDDGISYWRDVSFALDRGFPLIRVSHVAAEEAGIKSLAEWIRVKFGIETDYKQERQCARANI